MTLGRAGSLAVPNSEQVLGWPIGDQARAQSLPTLGKLHRASSPLRARPLRAGRDSTPCSKTMRRSSSPRAFDALQKRAQSIGARHLAADPRRRIRLGSKERLPTLAVGGTRTHVARVGLARNLEQHVAGDTNHPGAEGRLVRGRMVAMRVNTRSQTSCTTSAGSTRSRRAGRNAQMGEGVDRRCEPLTQLLEIGAPTGLDTVDQLEGWLIGCGKRVGAGHGQIVAAGRGSGAANRRDCPDRQDCTIGTIRAALTPIEAIQPPQRHIRCAFSALFLHHRADASLLFTDPPKENSCPPPRSSPGTRSTPP